MKRHVRLEVPFVAALALALSACGGGVSPGPQGGSSSPAGPSGSGATSSGGPSGAPPSAVATTGAAADVTASDGFKYHILVTSAPAALTQVKTTKGLIPKDAPPGQEFVTLNVEVTNTTDRQEPLEDLYFANDWGSKMVFGIPMSDSVAFGFHPVLGDPCEAQRVTADVCSLGGAVQSVTPSPTDPSTPQIAPGPDGRVTLLLATTRAIPSSAPLPKLQLLLVDPIRGGVLAQIPIPSG